jgi:hypothetical protein
MRPPHRIPAPWRCAPRRLTRPSALRAASQAFVAALSTRAPSFRYPFCAFAPMGFSNAPTGPATFSPQEPRSIARPRSRPRRAHRPRAARSSPVARRWGFFARTRAHARDGSIHASACPVRLRAGRAFASSVRPRRAARTTEGRPPPIRAQPRIPVRGPTPKPRAIRAAILVPTRRATAPSRVTRRRAMPAPIDSMGRSCRCSRISLSRTLEGRTR